MVKVALLVHMILATALAGALIIVIVSIPSLSEQGMKLIPIAVGAGIVAAIPASLWLSRRILEQTRGV